MLLRVAIASAVLLHLSCDESFNPKVPFVERPVLQGLLSVDAQSSSSLLTITLARTYDVEGHNPSANTTDPALHGVTAVVTYRDRIDTLVERQQPRSDSTRYRTPLSYYSAQLSLYAGDVVSVKAFPGPDMTPVTATTVVPTFKVVESQPRWHSGVTTMVDRTPYGGMWVFDWDYSLRPENLFFPKLVLSYMHWEDPSWVDKSIEVPMRLIGGRQERIPVYPTGITDVSCAYEFDALDFAMARISAGDTSKHNYLIKFMTFTLTEFDYALSRFYASTHGSLDQFSIRPDETVFSNIGGGIGILGSMLRSSWRFAVNGTYVQSFGYRTQVSLGSRTGRLQ